MDLPFLSDTAAAARTPDVNAAAVHPYRRAGPESVAAELLVFRELVSHTFGAKVEIWDTEWGYASYDYFSKTLQGDGHSQAGRKRQAVLAGREILTVWALGLPVAVWYDLRDDGDDPRNPEHNYGLLDASDSDKPAMKAIRTLTAFARNHTFTGMVKDAPDGAHAMCLDGSAGRIFAVWTDQPDSRISLRLSRDHFLGAADFAGEPLKIDGGKRDLVLAEADGPIYLKYSSR